MSQRKSSATSSNTAIVKNVWILVRHAQTLISIAAIGLIASSGNFVARRSGNGKPLLVASQMNRVQILFLYADQNLSRTRPGDVFDPVDRGAMNTGNGDSCPKSGLGVVVQKSEEYMPEIPGGISITARGSIIEQVMKINLLIICCA
jgi:hypothetical protein